MMPATEMQLHSVFLAIGVLLLVGLFCDEIGRRTRIPRVTLLILFGVVAGPSALDILPAAIQGWHEFLAAAALTMVAFLLGGKLSLGTMQQHGRSIVLVSLSVVIVTVVFVAAGLLLAGAPLIIALLLAGIATATAPASVVDVVHQTRAKGPFTDILLGIVAVDDAWGLVAFSLLLVLAKTAAGDGLSTVVALGILDIGGAIAIGLSVGLPAAYLTGRLKPGEPIRTEALAVVFLCAGLAQWLNVSFLLASLVAGTVVANCAKHHTRPFHEIEHIEWPFMILFFVLAGASLQIEALHSIGILGSAFIVLRFISRILGGWIGSALSDEQPLHRRWIGLALTPQAGVAIGMALVAADHFPDHKQTLLAVTIGAAVIFEIVGPPLTQTALRQVGNARA